MDEASINHLQETVGRMFAKVLDAEEVGIDDDFFAVGGHSIAAGRLIGLIRRDLNVRVSLFDFFQEPTISGLTALVVAGRSSGDGPGTPDSSRERQ